MKKVLVIEDDHKLSMALQMRLGMMNYEVSCAKDAVHAMDHANRCQPDIVILDVNLPGGDGFVVAERLRKHSKTATTPIIFITASELPKYKEKANSIPNASFLQKPFDAMQLESAMDASLGNV